MLLLFVICGAEIFVGYWEKVCLFYWSETWLNVTKTFPECLNLTPEKEIVSSMHLHDKVPVKVIV